ncbi:MAG TPA: ATP-binding protein [Methanosarcinales archaeon]|nr:ATP-binding protein [Methanosarcinales archaeon]
MTKIIAITGKGGTGKTTVSTLLIKYLENKDGSLLAIDADPDANLPNALGVTVEKTVGEMREDLLEQRDKIPPSVDKELLFESKIYEVLLEKKNYDLLVMGRSEGSGCYCYVNNLLRGIMDRITKNYNFAIVDTAAGLEHFSRKIIHDVDILFVVTDESRKGLQTAERIRDLVNELDLNLKKIYIIANKVNEYSLKIIKKYTEEMDMELVGAIPYDTKLVEFDLVGEPLINLPDDSLAVMEVENIAKTIGL